MFMGIGTTMGGELPAPAGRGEADQQRLLYFHFARLPQHLQVYFTLGAFGKFNDTVHVPIQANLIWLFQI